MQIAVHFIFADALYHPPPPSLTQLPSAADRTSSAKKPGKIARVTA